MDAPSARADDAAEIGEADFGVRANPYLKAMGTAANTTEIEAKTADLNVSGPTANSPTSTIAENLRETRNTTVYGLNATQTLGLSIF